MLVVATEIDEIRFSDFFFSNWKKSDEIHDKPVQVVIAEYKFVTRCVSPITRKLIWRQKKRKKSANIAILYLYFVPYAAGKSTRKIRQIGACFTFQSISKILFNLRTFEII